MTKKSISTEQILEDLSVKWQKAKIKLQKAQAKELALRFKLDAVLAKDGSTNASVTINHSSISLKRNTNYSIPKAGMIIIKANLDKELFTDTFTTSYSIKKAVYDAMDDNSPNKAIIDKHLTKKPSPLTATIKEIE